MKSLIALIPAMGASLYFSGASPVEWVVAGTFIASVLLSMTLDTLPKGK